MRWTSFLGVMALAAGTYAFGAGEATISSDQLEIQDGGRKSVFTGHVVLRQEPHVLFADRMVRTQPSGLVTAQGHLEARWLPPSGEKAKVLSELGRYDPLSQVIEVWGPPHVEVRLADKQRGTATFYGDRGWVFLDKKKARLEGHVRGHVIPGKQL
jgi:lipopolysaccharide export system protein LptA